MSVQEDLFPEGAMTRDAVSSPDGTHRYAHRRRWGAGSDLMCICLGPSTADHLHDDPTVRHCISFALRWGYDSVAVGNLVALRSPDPRELGEAPDPVEPENDEWLERLARERDTVVVAWGNGGTLLDRGSAVAERFPDLLYLGETERGQPRHPLSVRGATKPVPLAR